MLAGHYYRAWHALGRNVVDINAVNRCICSPVWGNLRSKALVRQGFEVLLNPPIGRCGYPYSISYCTSRAEFLPKSRKKVQKVLDIK